MSATSTLAVTHASSVLQLAEYDKDKVTPGVLGFIVFALIGGAVWLLMKSMTKHMKQVDFTEAEPGGEQGPDGGKRPDGAKGPDEGPASVASGSGARGEDRPA
ncbi:hypothetical protein NKH77_33245 [Streptomyces sp. M19]